MKKYSDDIKDKFRDYKESIFDDVHKNIGALWIIIDKACYFGQGPLAHVSCRDVHEIGVCLDRLLDFMKDDVDPSLLKDIRKAYLVLDFVPITKPIRKLIEQPLERLEKELSRLEVFWVLK